MRRVEFPLGDRLAVVPVEVIQSSKWALLIAAALFFLSGLGPAGYSWTQTISTGLVSATLFLLAYAFGTVLTPALLPWLPGRPLALKGFWAGLGLCAIAGVWQWQMHSTWSVLLETIALSLLIIATVSFMAMKFTGSTTYTSLSGVRREMRIAIPLQAVAAVFGIVLWVTWCKTHLLRLAYSGRGSNLAISVPQDLESAYSSKILVAVGLKSKLDHS